MSGTLHKLGWHAAPMRIHHLAPPRGPSPQKFYSDLSQESGQYDMPLNGSHERQARCQCHS